MNTLEAFIGSLVICLVPGIASLGLSLYFEHKSMKALVKDQYYQTTYFLRACNFFTRLAFGLFVVGLLIWVIIQANF